MDWRSLWFCLVGVVSAVFLCVTAVIGLTTDTNAQTAEASDAQQTETVPVQLAQYYYFPNYPYPQVRRKKRAPRRRAAPRCAFPWSYSRGLRRCICVQEGYSLSNGKCVKSAEICPPNEQWSAADNKCVCPEGFTQNGGQCIDPNRGVVTYDLAGESQCLWPRIQSGDNQGCVCSQGYREEAGQCIQRQKPEHDQRPRAAPDQLLTSDITTVQECLKEAGYLRAAVQSTMGRRAWTAYWFFKQDHSVGRTPKGVHDAGAQHKLFTLCPNTSAKLALLPPGNLPLKGAPPVSEQKAGVPPVPPSDNERKTAALGQPTAEGESSRSAKKPKKIFARPEASCLPGDLHRLIVDTYGARPNLRRCVQTCIAKPANITKREVKEFEEKRGVRWCRACIEIATQMPLQDILRIERGANVQVCTRPPSRLPKWVGRTAKRRPAYTRVRALFKNLPRNSNNKNSIAVVIGNGSYVKGVPKNASAAASADAFYALLTEHLGFEQENIIDLRDAALEDLTKVFGKADGPESELSRRVASKPDANVFVYYAGHAITRAEGGESYLLPIDAVKYREERSGYALSQLYANLQKLGAKSTLVMLDAEFGRDLSDYVFPPNLPEMKVGALPEKPMAGINILVAADGDQRTLDDLEYGIGLFTRYLIEGLAGRADLSPIGNGDGKIDTVELYAYTSHMVRLSARKSFGLLQRPMMSRSANMRVSHVQAVSQ